MRKASSTWVPACAGASMLAMSVLFVSPSAAAPGNTGHQASRHLAERALAARRSTADGVDIRAVLADPAIRRFIGLSEYAWDFNAPHGVPGFAPLSSTVRREPPRQLTADEAALSAVGPPAWVSTSIR
jgi:hypothetical protein